MFTYKATVLKVVDGDTMHLDTDLGFDIRLKQTVRLVGIDTPETSTDRGKEVRDHVRGLLPEGTAVTITTVKDSREKYGRYLAELWLPDGRSLNQYLLATGKAVAYFGGAKP